MRHCYGILIACLLASHIVVDATVDIYNILSKIVTSFSNRDATVIDTFMEGYIEYANPSDACSNIARPIFKPTSLIRNIVLINGTSNCDFMTKIQYAKEVGYEIAVLFDPFPGPFNYSDMTFPIPRSEINMSVVLVSCEDGIEIRKNYLYPKPSEWENVFVMISPSTWGLFLLYGFLGIIGLFVGAIVLAVLYVGFVEIWKKCKYRFRNQNEEQGIVEPENGGMRNYDNEEMLRSALRNLRRRFPSIEFSIGDSYDVCTICMYNFQAGERLRKLGCSHAYHADCIDAWLLHKGQKRTCPLCVKDVNLENSCEQSLCGPSESTPLLAFTHDQHSSSGTGDNSGPSNALDAVRCNPLRFAVEPSNLLLQVQGSVNHVQMNESGEEDTQPLIV